MSPTERVHQTEIQVRLADTDALGHVNASRYAEYAEASRLGFLAELGQTVGSLILAHLSIDFRAQVRFGQPVSVETRVERLGQRSVTLRQLVIAGEQLAADVRSVVVLFDYRRQRSQEIPAGLRERLALYIREDRNS
jgi:acyl-CoA thioester hydrolase